MDFQLSMAARTLWQEARGEPLEGQQAVAHVIANRVKDGRWGSTLFEVCSFEYHGVHQFSGWNFHDPNRKQAAALSDLDPNLVALAHLIYAAVNGEADPTGGATHYYNPKIVGTPIWVSGDPARKIPAATPCGKFGNQLFFKGVP